MFEKIEKWYRQSLWSESMVRKAVEKGILTEYEAAAILNA